MANYPYFHPLSSEFQDTQTPQFECVDSAQHVFAALDKRAGMMRDRSDESPPGGEAGRLRGGAGAIARSIQEALRG